MSPEPNGSCPLGRENKTNIVAQGREIDEVKTRLHEIDEGVQELTIRMERTTVKLGVIVAVIVGLMTTVGQIVLASLMNGGG